MAPKGTWKNKLNHKIFFYYLQRQLEINEKEDWYLHLSLLQIQKLGGRGMMVEFYNNSPLSFLKEMVPNYLWLPWKFKCVPMGFWKKIESHVWYFEWLCVELNFNVPDSFYSLTLNPILKNYGWGLLQQYYSNSFESFVFGLNPEVKWVEWKFKGTKKWENTKNHRKFFEWLGDKMGFTCYSDWSHLTAAHISFFNGIALISRYYNGSVNEFVSKYLKERKKEKEEILNQKEMQDWLHRTISEIILISQTTTVKKPITQLNKSNFNQPCNLKLGQ